MAYNKEADKCLSEKEISIDTGQSIVLGIYSYDGGPIKIGLVRKFATNSGTPKWGSLGRISISEAKILIPEIQSAIKEAEKLSKQND